MQGTVISTPPAAQKPQPNSEYDLTSIMATTRILLGIPTTPLTDRDAWVRVSIPPPPPPGGRGGGGFCAHRIASHRISLRLPAFL